MDATVAFIVGAVFGGAITLGALGVAVLLVGKWGTWETEKGDDESSPQDRAACLFGFGQWLPSPSDDTDTPDED